MRFLTAGEFPRPTPGLNFEVADDRQMIQVPRRDEIWAFGGVLSYDGSTLAATEFQLGKVRRAFHLQRTALCSPLVPFGTRLKRVAARVYSVALNNSFV